MKRLFAGYSKLLRAAVVLSLLVAAEAGLWWTLPYRPRLVLPPASVIDFSADSSALLTEHSDPDCVKVWDAKTGELRATVAGRFRSGMGAMAEDRTRFTCFEDSFLICDAASGQVIRNVEALAHLELPKGTVIRIDRFSPDVSLVVLQAGEDRCVLFDLERTRQLLVIPSCWPRFSPDSRTFAYQGGDEPSIILWDIPGRRERCRVEGDLYTARFSPDSQLIAAAQGSTVRLYDAATGAERLRLQAVPGKKITELLFAADGRILLTATKVLCRDEDSAEPGHHLVIQVWDPSTGSERARYEPGFSSPVDLDFSPDGRYLSINGNPPFQTFGGIPVDPEPVPPGLGPRPKQPPWLMQVVDLTTTPPSEVWSVWDHEVRAADGRLLASLGEPNPTARPLTASKSADAFDILDFAPDGKTVALRGIYHHVDSKLGLYLSRWTLRTSNDLKRTRDLLLLDIATGRQLATLEVGFAYEIFSPDGKTLLTHGDEKELLLWDVPPGIPLAWLLLPPLLFGFLWGVWRAWRWLRRRKEAVA